MIPEPKPDLSHPGLLIVEDDPEIREQMKWALMPTYQIFEAKDRASAVDIVRAERPLLVAMDLGLPPHPDEVSEGLAALDEMLAIDPLAKIIVVTGNSERSSALKAVALGAYDFIQKPVQLDVLKVVLQRAWHLSSIERENRMLLERASTDAFYDILGSSPPMQKVFEIVRRVSASDIPVLIAGPSGSGKELVAKAIHRQSERRNGPFVAINCGAIPESLLESELFGHEKGAFTGAHVQRKGRIEAAEGGTLFLDEIGELSAALQVKLLRFLQERQLERVGGREAISVDARVLAATNIDLQKSIGDGRFREDLYYRVCGVSITLPPLREREGDVELLATAFLKRYADEHKKAIRGFTRQASEAMKQYSWPGNVRQLQHCIQRAVIMAQGAMITWEDLGLPCEPAGTELSSLKKVREEAEKTLIRQALAKHNGNITKTATELGISRPTLHDLIAKYSLKKA
jgi:two-component system NtrC family response regulator